jgi:hypothetical protein
MDHTYGLLEEPGAVAVSQARLIDSARYSGVIYATVARAALDPSEGSGRLFSSLIADAAWGRMVRLGIVVAWAAACSAQCGDQDRDGGKQPAPQQCSEEEHGGVLHGPAMARARPQVLFCSVTTNACAKSPSL